MLSIGKHVNISNRCNGDTTVQAGDTDPWQTNCNLNLSVVWQRSETMFKLQITPELIVSVSQTLATLDPAFFEVGKN